jgi:hypothetical protein
MLGEVEQKIDKNVVEVDENLDSQDEIKDNNEIVSNSPVVEEKNNKLDSICRKLKNIDTGDFPEAKDIKFSLSL